MKNCNVTGRFTLTSNWNNLKLNDIIEMHFRSMARDVMRPRFCTATASPAHTGWATCTRVKTQRHRKAS